MTAPTKRIAVAVRLKSTKWGQPGIRVELADLAADATTRGWVERIIFDDGSESWGKCWTYWTGKDDNDINGKHVYYRIGAGAYGDSNVWKHPRAWGQRVLTPAQHAKRVA